MCIMCVQCYVIGKFTSPMYVKKTLLIDYRLVESGNELRKYKHIENKHISHGNVIAYRLSI